MRVKISDIHRTDMLVRDLKKFEDRSKVDKEIEGINRELMQAGKEFEETKITQDQNKLSELYHKIETLRGKKENAWSQFYNAQEVPLRQLEGINKRYMEYFANEILKEAREVEAQKYYFVEEFGVDFFDPHYAESQRDIITKKYRIKHNFATIDGILQILSEARTEIMRTPYRVLAEIKKIYDDALEAIPDDLDQLNDVTECGDTGLKNFRDFRLGAPLFETQDRYIQPHPFQNPFQYMGKIFKK
jgi:hypothetical protein